MAPGRGSSSSTISSTVTSVRSEARTTSFWTPTMPQSWTLPRPIGPLRVDDADVGAERRHRRELLAGEGADDRGDARVRHEVGPRVAAEDAEGQARRAGRIRGRHARVRVLLELERRRPLVLDRVAQPVQRPDARVPAPAEDELAGAAHPDHLVVDEVGRHPHEREVPPLLTDHLVGGGVRDQVREAFERNGVAVVHDLPHRFRERDDLCHVASSERERMPASGLHGDPTELRELVDHRLAAEAPPAGLLDAAERHLRLVADRLVVDVHDPGLELLREREAAVGVRGEDPGAQAVGRCVRAPDRLVGVVDDLDREHRAEGLVPREVESSGTSVTSVAW